jgi:hypothetical protein
LLQPSKIAELTVDNDSDKVRASSDIVQLRMISVQLREVLKVYQGCHNLNLTAKEQVVMSTAVQFRLVYLTKRMPLRVGHMNRFNRQKPYNGHTPLSLRAV